MPVRQRRRNHRLEQGESSRQIRHVQSETVGLILHAADLIGAPLQVIAGPRGVANGEVEIKDRKTGERETLTIEAAINRLTSGN